MFARKRQLILDLLAQHGEMYASEIVERSAGWIGRILVFPLLDELEAAGHVSSRVIVRDVDTGRRRYRLTGSGLANGWSSVLRTTKPVRRSVKRRTAKRGK